METKAYTTIDRAGWPSGEWDGEPDKLQWPDEATGLPCLAVRHDRLGHWCGYVGVPPGHPLAGHSYGDVDDVLDVHGGVTYAHACQTEAPEGEGICHIPGPGEPDHVYWFGFDMAHAGDYSPGMHREEIERLIGHLHVDETYRPLAYVKAECASLARQLHERGATVLTLRDGSKARYIRSAEPEMMVAE